MTTHATITATITATGLALALGLLSSAGPAQSVISPSDRQSLEGSASSSYPLGRFNSRFQQLYADLQSAMTIKGHAYRRDAISTRTRVEAFKTEMEISMSPAALTPAKASRTFAQNPGASPVKVLARAVMDLPRTVRPQSFPAASFEFRIPYSTPYSHFGSGAVCLDMVIYSNLLATGANKNFLPSLDAHELYSSGRNLQPGYPYGVGCKVNGNNLPARATFELRHLGATMDVSIAGKYGLPSDANGKAGSVLLLGQKIPPVAWPPASGCNLYTSTTTLVFLPGENDAKGNWSAVLKGGAAPPALFEIAAQLGSIKPATAEIVMSEGHRLVIPPAGAGLVGARIVNASDRLAATGTVSYSVSVTEFF